MQEWSVRSIRLEISSTHTYSWKEDVADLKYVCPVGVLLHVRKVAAVAMVRFIRKRYKFYTSQSAFQPHENGGTVIVMHVKYLHCSILATTLGLGAAGNSVQSNGLFDQVCITTNENYTITVAVSFPPIRTQTEEDNTSKAGKVVKSVLQRSSMSFVIFNLYMDGFAKMLDSEIAENTRNLATKCASGPVCFLQMT